MYRIIVCCLVSVFIGCYATKKVATLKQLHVIFRHGERAPVLESFYPNDPHINDTWYPEGYGGLTLRGKLQEYNIGRALRRKYYKFLGRIYTPDVLDALSTDTNRTKMSLELVLAGLWPPAPSQTWNAYLPWQPIPYNYVENERDTLLNFKLLLCPNYMEEYRKVEEYEKFTVYLENNADMISYINENSGLNITSIHELYGLYLGLFAEEQTGRALPAWTEKVYPEFLRESAEICYELQIYNDLLKRLTGGLLVKKIIDDARAKINGSLQPRDRKLFLYSGHEYNIVYLLGALNVYKPHVPPYASYVVLELHEIYGVYGFKILYQDYNQLRELTIPGCQSFCPIDKFIELTKNIIPIDDSSC